jgi:hypothetical protein
LELPSNHEFTELPFTVTPLSALNHKRKLSANSIEFIENIGDIPPKIFCLGQIPAGQIYNIRNF